MKASNILASLIHSFDAGCLHHALLFTGPENFAKQDVVERLMCYMSAGARSNDLFSTPLPEDAILEKIKRGNHPDLFKMKPLDGVISVDEVRALGKVLSYAPLEAKKRIILLEDAGGMNAQAANAVLKSLEEPPSHTMFALFCSDASELMPTILSRCQELRFAPPTDEEILHQLKIEFTDRNLDELQKATVLASGSFLRAKKFLQIENPLPFFQTACEQIINYWENSPRIPSSIVQWAESFSEVDQINWIVDIWELVLRDLSLGFFSEQDYSIFPEFRVRMNDLRNNIALNPALVAEKKTALNRFRVYRELNGNLKLDFINLICDLNFSVGKRTVPA